MSDINMDGANMNVIGQQGSFEGAVDGIPGVQRTSGAVNTSEIASSTELLGHAVTTDSVARGSVAGGSVATDARAVGLELARKLLAEALGTALLIVAVIGSGIAASRLSSGDVGVQLLQNALATTGALIGLILMFASVSGAHFNPAVTLLNWLLGATSKRDTGLYVIVQVIGGCAGAMLANLMFELPVIHLSTTERFAPSLWLSEVVATVTLLLLIHGCIRTGRANVVPFAVGTWIGAAYWFTSSTSFANPAVTIARTLSDTFAGIAPASAPMFIGAQLLGTAVAFALVRFLYPNDESGTTIT